jgi:hypothetical protein
MKLAEAKARLTVHELWRHFGFEGQPSKSCRCPFHEDKSASLSVTPDGALFNCFAGCGGGDAVDFYTLASGLPHADACRAFIRLAGGASVPPMPRRAPAKADVDAMKAEQRRSWPLFTSPLTSPAGTEQAALPVVAKLRHVSLAGVELMAARGLLWFTVWKELPAWIVTDGERLNAQARRMDGWQWESIGAKAQTLPGSRAAWPVGVKEAQTARVILLCEGVDILAAHHFIAAHGREADTAAVAMLGASNTIPADALPLFAGKRIRVMAHADKAKGGRIAGHVAARNWKHQLDTVGAHVDAADFTGLLMADGSPVKDLNDCSRLDPKQNHELEDLIPTE